MSKFLSFMTESNKNYDQKIKEISDKVSKIHKELKDLQTKEIDPLWDKINSHESVLAVASKKSNLIMRKLYHNVYNAINELEKWHL